MHDPFDPYWQWLAIPPAEQPPDHYRLLGLRMFESDHQLIARAVELRIGHLRASDDGQHPESAKRLFEHVAAARDTLLSLALKAQYDNLLFAKQSARGAVPSGASARPVDATGERGNQPGRGSVSPASLLVCGVAAASALVLGLMLWRSSPEEPVGARPLSRGDARQTADRAARAQTPSRRPARNVPGTDSGGRSSSSERETARQPRGPETMADLMHQADDTAIDASTVTGKLAAARRAMWSRELAAARGHVEAAIGQARTSTERAEVQRVGKLLETLDAFWSAVRETLGRLESGHELQLGEATVTVVRASGETLTVRAAGRNSTYGIKDLPQGLAVALAERSLPKDRPAADLAVGSFLAIDLHGDRHNAQTRWERAGTDGKALLPELALAPPVDPAELETPARFEP